jgi:hypothetical protein
MKLFKTLTLSVLLLTASVQAQDSLNVERIGQVTLWDLANAIEIVDDLAYVADYAAGLQIVDVSNPEEAERLSWCNIPCVAHSLDIVGIYTYVAAGDSGLFIVNVADTFFPVIAGHCACPGYSYDVVVSGEYAYVACGEYGLQVIDISNVTDPVIIGNLDTPGETQKIFIEGDLAYLADGDGGLRIVDIEDPEFPVELGTLTAETETVDVYVQGIYAYIADYYEGLRIINVADPTAPVQVGSYFAQFCNAIDVHGDIAYLNWNFILHILDVSNPTIPYAIGYALLPYRPRDITISNGLAFHACFNTGVTILDVTIPSAPFEVGQFGGNNCADEVEVSGSYAFVDAYRSFLVFDISLPFYPQEIASIHFGSIRGLTLGGDFIYLIQERTLHAIDVCDPYNPETVSSQDVSGSCTDIIARDGYLYMVSTAGGLQVFDLSDPGSPALAGSYEFYNTHNITLDDQIAYITADEILWVIDITVPETPELITTYDIGVDGYEMDVYADVLYLACDDEELKLIDVSDPGTPFEVDSYIAPDHIYYVHFDGRFIYLSCGYTGLQILENNYWVSWEEVGYYNTPGSARNMTIVDENIYLGDDTYLGVYEFHEPPVAVQPGNRLIPQSFSFSPHPNPFNSTTVISFELPVAGKVKFNVFDVNGRNVGAFRETPSTNQRYPAGIHYVLFDGSDLASGVYLVQMQAEDYMQTRKVVLLK